MNGSRRNILKSRGYNSADTESPKNESMKPSGDILGG